MVLLVARNMVACREGRGGEGARADRWTGSENFVHKAARRDHLQLSKAIPTMSPSATTGPKQHLPPTYGHETVHTSTK